MNYKKIKEMYEGKTVTEEQFDDIECNVGFVDDNGGSGRYYNKHWYTAYKEYDFENDCIVDGTDEFDFYY